MSSFITCKLCRLSYSWSILDAPSRRHWTLSFFKDHAMASCAKEHPNLSARAHTSRNLSEYFRVSSSADFSFHAYSCIAKTIISVFRNKSGIASSLNRWFCRIILIRDDRNKTRILRFYVTYYVISKNKIADGNLNLEINIDKIWYI